MSMHRSQKIFLYTLLAIGICGIVVYFLFLRLTPGKITYGVSFNTLYANELGLSPRKTYLAILNDLGVKHLRLAAHWTMIEPKRGTFDFSELDFQITEAKKHGAEVILGVGRRLPRWPECHIPSWAESLSWEEQKTEIRQLIEAVVLRYKPYDTITYWQVENEPYLTVFAEEQCGKLDEDFLKEEIALVKRLDPERPVLLTDSGNLGVWAQPYKNADVFGTSIYIYFWHPIFGTYKSLLPPIYYRIKHTLVELLYGEKPAFLIELSLEPWLLQSVVDTPLKTQFERMDTKKFDEIITFARDTGFDVQYLWGAEWWYWLKTKGEDSFWKKAEILFRGDSSLRSVE